MFGGPRGGVIGAALALPPWRAKRASGGAGGAAEGVQRRPNKPERTSERLCLCCLIHLEHDAALFAYHLAASCPPPELAWAHGPSRLGGVAERRGRLEKHVAPIAWDRMVVSETA
eukprot:9476678-Pyramimonas_sp.AAC.2